MGGDKGHNSRTQSRRRMVQVPARSSRPELQVDTDSDILATSGHELWPLPVTISGHAQSIENCLNGALLLLSDLYDAPIGSYSPLSHATKPYLAYNLCITLTLTQVWDPKKVPPETISVDSKWPETCS